MILESMVLEKPLENHIESIFYYKGYKPDHSIERVVPTGHVFIIFELDGFDYNTFDRKTLKPNGTFNKVWVSGMHKDYLSISAHQDSEMLVIQFKTSGTYPFLNTPVHLINNKVTAAEKIFGNEILLLRDQIIEKDSVLEKFKSVQNWLESNFVSSNVPNDNLKEILTLLKEKPLSEHNEVIEPYQNSQKHLISQFKKYFGLTPKVFHRIFRFNNILNGIHNKQALKWAQIAYEFGYSDQSHFIKEFKEFSGFNPQEFIQSSYHNEVETNFFPVDKRG